MHPDTEDALPSRRYLGQLVAIRIDRPEGSRHPEHGFVYPLNYGYVPGTLAADGEPLEAYVIGADGPLSTFAGRCVAVIHRLDDDDDKLVLVPDGHACSDEEIRLRTAFQERFFGSVILR